MGKFCYYYHIWTEQLIRVVFHLGISICWFRVIRVLWLCFLDFLQFLPWMLKDQESRSQYRKYNKTSKNLHIYCMLMLKLLSSTTEVSGFLEYQLPD